MVSAMACMPRAPSTSLFVAADAAAAAADAAADAAAAAAAVFPVF